MNKEDFFISLFDNSFLGDDGAVIDDIVVSKDLFCENIHFKREWMSLKEIAVKSMLVNISDAVVMNAKPRYALIGIKLPKDISFSEMKELKSGFEEICKEYDIKIIGGDTVSSDRLDISITIISYSKKPIYRKGLKKGDLVAYTGSIGRCYKDLTKLLRGKKIYSKSKFIKPILRDKFFHQASKYMTTALDISDGLSKDLSRLSKKNRVGFRFLKKLSKSKWCSGEEYEILFSFKKRDRKKIVSLGKRYKTPINIFAIAKKGSYKSICRENHFR